MENKINIAEFLKDCPKGMNLDCTVYDNCTLETVFEGCLYPIQIQTPEGLINLTKYGSMSQSTHSKCVIFPKGKTTWEGFQMPFKNGDIVATSTGNWIGITTGGEKNCFIPTYCIINNDGKFEAYFDRKGKWGFSRLATEEEKQKLFQAIEDNGYKWNDETKTLEELLKFKDGDIIFTHANCLKVGLGNTWISIFQGKRNGGVATYVDYAEDGSDYYSDLDGDKALLCMESDILRQRFASEEEKAKLFQAIKDNGYHWNPETKTLDKLPKFKVGNNIREKDDKSATFAISDIDDSCYYCGDYVICNICDQDDWELAPNKFDIATLKPFDKVFVRDNNTQEWVISFFSHCNGLEIYKYSCINGSGYAQCVPYEENKHLLGTTNDCDDFYKTWEK